MFVSASIYSDAWISNLVEPPLCFDIDLSLDCAFVVIIFVIHYLLFTITIISIFSIDVQKLYVKLLKKTRHDSPEE